MERIVLEVDDATGEAYRKFSHDTKAKFTLAISLLIKKAVNDAGKAGYEKLLDDIGNDATKNGLTAEVLDELLHSND